MENINLLKAEYEGYLLKELSKHKAKEKRLRDEGAIDESNFEKIRYNVVDIFQKMFVISYNKGIKDNSIETLNETYKGYYDKIPSGWRVRLEKAKEYNEVKDIVVEEIKIEKLEEIFKVFDEAMIKYKG